MLGDFIVDRANSKYEGNGKCFRSNLSLRIRYKNFPVLHRDSITSVRYLELEVKDKFRMCVYVRTHKRERERGGWLESERDPNRLLPRRSSYP